MTILNDLLDVSKLEAGKLDLEVIPFRPMRIMEDTVDVMATRAEEKGLAFNTAVDPDIPDSLMGDPNRLRQILLNLLSNAIKFTSEGSITLALERVRHRQNQKGDSQGSQKVIQAMSWVKGGQPWMTRPYSEDLRERVVRVVESGTSRNAAAKQFDVSISFVVKLMQRWKQRGTIKADKYGGWKKSKLAPHGDRIRALVMENCDITIDELCVLLAAEGIEAKRSTLGDFLLAQGLSRKKRQPTPPSRSALTSRRREPLGATSNLG